jgi:preprotein translocase subunit YajC
LPFILVMLLMLAFMYLLLIRPQRAQSRRHKDLLSNLKVGDEVITAGGIYGDVAGIEDEKVHLLIAEDVEIEVSRRSIATVVPQDSAVVDAEAEEAGEPAEIEAAGDDKTAETDQATSESELEEAGRARGAQPRRED